MRQRLHPFEALFAVAALASLTVLTALGTISPESYPWGLGALLSYAFGIVNGFKRGQRSGPDDTNL